MTKPTTDNPAVRMPVSETELKLLKQSARRLAELELRQEVKSSLSYVRVSFGGEGLFDIPRDDASELLTAAGVAWVPFVPSFIRGVVSLHGEMIAVVDLADFFAMKPLKLTPDKLLLVVKKGRKTVGLLLDDFIDEVSFEEQALAAPMTGGSIKENYVKGVHEGLVTVLDIPAVLDAVNLAG